MATARSRFVAAISFPRNCRPAVSPTEVSSVMVLLPERTKAGVDVVWKDAKGDSSLRPVDSAKLAAAATLVKTAATDSTVLALRATADSLAADSARRVRRKHRRDSLTALADSALARGDTARADSIRVLLQPRKRVAPDTTKPVTP